MQINNSAIVFLTHLLGKCKYGSMCQIQDHMHPNPCGSQLLALEQGLAKLVKVLESKNLMTLGGVESHSKFMCI